MNGNGMIRLNRPAGQLAADKCRGRTVVIHPATPVGFAFKPAVDQKVAALGSAGRQSVGNTENGRQINRRFQCGGPRADGNFREPHFQILRNAFVINPCIPEVAIIQGICDRHGDQRAGSAIRVDGYLVGIDASRRGGLRPTFESVELHIQTLLDAGVASTAITKGKGTVALKRECDAVTRTPQGWVAQAEDEESAETDIVSERKWIAAKSTAGLSGTGLRQFEDCPVAVGCIGGTAVELKALGIGKIMEGEGSRRAGQVRQERGLGQGHGNHAGANNYRYHSSGAIGNQTGRVRTEIAISMHRVLRRAGCTVAKTPVPIRHVIAGTVHAGTGKMHGQWFRAGIWAGGDDEAGCGRSIANLVEKAGIKPVRAAGILGVEPLQAMRSGRNGICFLRPAQPGSRYFILWNSVQIEFEKIIIGFAGYLPPEGQTAAAGDRGLK